MAEHSAIEWTDATWNPTTGCTKVSPGCAHCYIERTPPFRIAGRTFAAGDIPVQLHPDRLTIPLRRRKPTRYFVNSLSDLFHEHIPDSFIDRVFAVMALAPRHTFQVLTKRAERMRAYCSAQDRPARLDSAIGDLFNNSDVGYRVGSHKCFVQRDGVEGYPLPNVWLGVSVENQHFADERIPLLLQTPAAVRFISAEPLLGPLDLNTIAVGDGTYYDLAYIGGPGRFDRQSRRMSNERIDWVIVGGESGPGSRPMHPQWARSLRDQCQAAGVPFFFKQWGEWQNGSADPHHDHRVMLTDGRALSAYEYRDAFIQTPGELWPTAVAKVGKKAAGRLLDGREWNEFPEVRA